MDARLPTPRGEVILRPSRAEDWQAYRELRLEALRDHPTAFGADYNENLLHPDEFWQKRVSPDSEQQAFFFAEQARGLIGMTGIFRKSGRKSKHAATVWGVYVRPEWRGLHLAEKLIEACLEWGRRNEIVIASLGVAVDNKPAIRCYERSGFTRTGALPKAIQYEGVYVDEYLMFRSLEDQT